MVVAPNLDVIRKGVLIGFVAKLGSGLGGILARRSLSRSLTLGAAITRVVNILQMVFTNMIMAFHGNMITYRPFMNSMATGRCRSADAVHSKGGY
jgi:hypothetical protein